MQRGQGSRHFQISKRISVEMRAGSNVGDRERLVGVLNRAQVLAPFLTKDESSPVIGRKLISRCCCYRRSAWAIGLKEEVALVSEAGSSRPSAVAEGMPALLSVRI